MHAQRIVHRDLKPENLLLTKDGTLKISDFGMCGILPKTKTKLLKTICGTENFAAPEVLLGNKYDGEKADIWSCGCILFAM